MSNLHPIFAAALSPFSPGAFPTPRRAICACGEPLTCEMEFDAGICLECQKATAEHKEQAS